MLYTKTIVRHNFHIHDITLINRVLSKNPGYSTSPSTSTTNSPNPLMPPPTEGQYWAQVSYNRKKLPWKNSKNYYFDMSKLCYVKTLCLQ